MRITIAKLQNDLRGCQARLDLSVVSAQEHAKKYREADSKVEDLAGEIKTLRHELSHYYRRDTMRLNTLLEYFMCIANPVTAADAKRVAGLQSAVTDGSVEARASALAHFQSSTSDHGF